MKSIAIFCSTILAGTALDLVSKWLIYESSKNSEYITIIPNFLGIICNRNEGIAFGLFQGKGNVLIYFTLFAIAFIVWIYYSSNKSDTLNTIGLGLILAGAAGNLFDRIVYHSVRDFIDLHAGRYHWPTFNVADALICVGVGFVIFRVLRAKDTPEVSET